MTAGLAFLALALQVPPLQGLQQPRASIEGFVLRTETNEPLARATVDVIRNAMRTGSVLRREAVVSSSSTDDGGHFIVKDLDAGSYSVVAKRNGFVRQEYGERAPGRGGTLLNITAGQT